MLRIGKKDKAVIRAFTEKRAKDGHKLTSDGQKLDGYWMGGTNLAYWQADKIHFVDLGSRSAQTVQNAIRREAPRNDLAPGDRRNPASTSPAVPARRTNIVTPWRSR